MREGRKEGGDELQSLYYMTQGSRPTLHKVILKLCFVNKMAVLTA